VKIVCLVEDTTDSNQIKAEHGISLYIETKNHHMLFDLGQSDLFLQNAQKLGISIEEVDTVVISHGHYDHGGGLAHFLKINHHAKIYINIHAFDAHYSERVKGEFTYIGLDRALKRHQQVVCRDGDYDLDDELHVFSKISNQDYYPKSNQTLYKEESGLMMHDDFNHEQNLLIKENNHYVLFAGCAHHGIVNIVERANHRIQPLPLTAVISGFHFASRFIELAESEQSIREIGNHFKTMETQFFTGHCTGIEPYHMIKEVMNDQIKYFKAGTIIKL